MKNIDNLNKQAQKGDGVKVVTQYNGTLIWDEGDPNEETFFATGPDGDEMELGYDEIIRMSDDPDGSILKSLQESKKRRYTVKEIRMWIKKLEENRYKKVYNSDARRVAWMVNNEGRTLDEMPMSMKKKWSKAQYGRERYLATEFLNSKKQQMAENQLRSLIRKVIINEIRGVNEKKKKL